MKKRLGLLPLLALCLTGCSTSNGVNQKMYLDVPSFVDGDLEFCFSGVTEQALGDYYQLQFSIDITNRNSKPKDITIKDATVIKESNDAQYSANGFYSNPIHLECDLKSFLSYRCNVPTSIKDENYHFEFSYGAKKAIAYFYDKPDELKKEIELSFVIDGSKTEKKSIKEGTLLSEITWVSADYVYGCSNWFFDKDYLNEIPLDYRAYTSMKVYGQQLSILKYQLPDAINSSYVSGYNFIPDSGEIVVPKAFSGKNVFGILAGSFRDKCEGLRSIFIPKTISKISNSYNFTSCSDLINVFFEGSESEWNSINEASFK